MVELSSTKSKKPRKKLRGFFVFAEQCLLSAVLRLFPIVLVVIVLQEQDSPLLRLINRAEQISPARHLQDEPAGLLKFPHYTVSTIITQGIYK